MQTLLGRYVELRTRGLLDTFKGHPQALEGLAPRRFGHPLSEHPFDCQQGDRVAQQEQAGASPFGGRHEFGLRNRLVELDCAAPRSIPLAGYPRGMPSLHIAPQRAGGLEYARIGRQTVTVPARRSLVNPPSALHGQRPQDPNNGAAERSQDRYSSILHGGIISGPTQEEAGRPSAPDSRTRAAARAVPEGD